MTNDIQYKDDMALSAYLDGALGEKETREIEARLEGEPALAARLDALRAGDAAFRKDAETVDDVPKSEGLTSLLDRLKKSAVDAPPEIESGVSPAAPSSVVPFPLWRRAARALATHRAIAASVALLGVFAVAQAVLSDRAPQGWSGDGRIAASSDIGEALNTQLSGDRAVFDGGARFSPRLSYRSDSGAFCRVFELSHSDRTTQNVACREDAGWRIAFSVTAPAGTEASAGEYETASSKINETLDRYLDAAMAGAPLTREGEAAAVEQEWKE